jgi:hypothetical protein
MRATGAVGVSFGVTLLACGGGGVVSMSMPGVRSSPMRRLRAQRAHIPYNAPAGERTPLGTLYRDVRWEVGVTTGNRSTNASIEVAVENVVDGAGRATDNECSNQELEHFRPECLQVQARVVRRHG